MTLDLESAILNFKNLVMKRTGDWSTLDRQTGFWRRTLQPGQKAIFDHPADETIIVSAGSIAVSYQKATINLQKGCSAQIKGGESHTVVAGEHGATFEVKFSW